MKLYFCALGTSRPSGVPPDFPPQLFVLNIIKHNTFIPNIKSFSLRLTQKIYKKLTLHSYSNTRLARPPPPATACKKKPGSTVMNWNSIPSSTKSILSQHTCPLPPHRSRPFSHPSAVRTVYTQFNPGRERRGLIALTQIHSPCMCCRIVRLSLQFVYYISSSWDPSGWACKFIVLL